MRLLLLLRVYSRLAATHHTILPQHKLQLLMRFEDFVDKRNTSSLEGAAVVGYDGFNANASVRDLLNGLCREVCLQDARPPPQRACTPVGECDCDDPRSCKEARARIVVPANNLVSAV